MRFSKYLPISLLLFAFFLVAAPVQAQTPDGGKAIPLKLKGQETDEEEMDMPLTTIEFAETEYFFGNITQGEEVKHTFRFKNVGENDLILENVKPSCTCTTLEWPKEAIKPGASGEIVMAFATEDKSGDQHKYLTIFYNGNPHVERLKITGTIMEAEMGGGEAMPQD